MPSIHNIILWSKIVVLDAGRGVLIVKLCCSFYSYWVQLRSFNLWVGRRKTSSLGYFDQDWWKWVHVEGVEFDDTIRNARRFRRSDRIKRSAGRRGQGSDWWLARHHGKNDVKAVEPAILTKSARCSSWPFSLASSNFSYAGDGRSLNIIALVSNTLLDVTIFANGRLSGHPCW